MQIYERMNLPFVPPGCRIKGAQCSPFYSLCVNFKGDIHILFKQGFDPLGNLMDYENQRCLGLFLLEHTQSCWTTIQRSKGTTHVSETSPSYIGPCWRSFKDRSLSASKLEM